MKIGIVLINLIIYIKKSVYNWGICLFCEGFDVSLHHPKAFSSIFEVNFTSHVKRLCENLNAFNNLISCKVWIIGINLKENLFVSLIVFEKDIMVHIRNEIVIVVSLWNDFDEDIEKNRTLYDWLANFYTRKLEKNEGETTETCVTYISLTLRNNQLLFGLLLVGIVCILIVGNMFIAICVIIRYGDIIALCREFMFKNLTPI